MPTQHTGKDIAEQMVGVGQVAEVEEKALHNGKRSHRPQRRQHDVHLHLTGRHDSRHSAAGTGLQHSGHNEQWQICLECSRPKYDASTITCL